MPFLIQITSYSFTESGESFDKFLQTFREGVKEHFNILVHNRFTDLLQNILDEAMAMKVMFFTSLDHPRAVLERAFTLLKQK